MDISDVESRARSYAAANGLKINFEYPVGNGTDGSVWFTDRNTAIKVLVYEKNYVRERNCYQRFKRLDIAWIDDLRIPGLIAFDDELRIVEMEVVQPPYLLDFGKAYIDEPLPYDPEQVASYFASLGRWFRAEDVPRVRKICRILNGFGIEYLDAKPANIRLRNDADEKNLPEEDWEKEPPVDDPIE